MLSSMLRIEFAFKWYGLKISLWSNDTPLDVVLKRGVFYKSEKKMHHVKMVLVTLALVSRSSDMGISQKEQRGKRLYS